MGAFGNLLAILLIVMFWILTLVLVVSYFFVWRAWIRATMSGVPIPFLSILGMRLRGVPPILVVDAYSALRRAGVDATVREVEESYLANRTRVRTSQDLIGLVKSRPATEPAVTP